MLEKAEPQSVFWEQLPRGSGNSTRNRYILQRANMKGQSELITLLPDIRYGIAQCRVCTAGFWSSFGLLFPDYALIPLFWNDNICSVPLHVGNMQFAFDFAAVYNKGFILISEKTWTFK